MTQRKTNYGARHPFCGHMVDTDEIQEMVNAAHFALLVDSSVQYGLLAMLDEQGKPMKESGVNVDRCVMVLEEGKKLGFIPQENYI